MTKPLIVLYNDTCPICSREVAGYKRQTNAEHLDVTYCGLTSAEYSDFGLSEDEAARKFHVVVDGQLVSGMPAFQMLWSQSSRLSWLAKLTGLPVIRQVVTLAYDYIFAPFLFAAHKRRQRLGKSKKQD